MPEAPEGPDLLSRGGLPLSGELPTGSDDDTSSDPDEDGSSQYWEEDHSYYDLDGPPKEAHPPKPDYDHSVPELEYRPEANKLLIRQRSRPMLHRYQKANFFKKNTTALDLNSYQLNIVKATKVYVVNQRSSIVANDWLWRMHSFLEQMHLHVNRGSRRLFYSLTRIDFTKLVLDKNRKNNIRRLLHMHPSLRVFA